MKKSISEVVHETAKGLYDADVMDAKTMRKYDALCLPEIHKMKPDEIKKMRLREKVSQPILAKYLNVSVSTVRHWEREEKVPCGAALKLLNMVESEGLELGLRIVSKAPVCLTINDSTSPKNEIHVDGGEYHKFCPFLYQQQNGSERIGHI